MLNNIIIYDYNMDNFIKDFNKIYNNKCSNKYLQSILPPTRRIIVIGDIHGDMSMLIKCLKIAKLINSNYNWIGQDTVVVQVGDQIDSCRYNGIDSCNDADTYDVDKADDVNILYFLTELHNKAIKEGGAVYSLMGNHELMNVMGDLSYVSHSNIRHFDNYNHNGNIIEDGYNGRKVAFEPGNHIANFLACTRKMALIIGSNLFVHAGMVPQIIDKYKIDDMNKLLTLFLLDEIKQPELFKDLFLSSKTSPFWTRLFGTRIDNCIELLQPLKDIYNVNRIYVGHTPQLKTGITSKCNSNIWLTDVGMSKAFNQFDTHNNHNHRSIHRMAQVLEILNDGEEINVLK
jgi:hypothetical protein